MKNGANLSSNIPLIVDLDHTLIDTDLLYESSIAVLKKSPWLIFLYPFWFAKGKGYLKDQLVKRFSINAQTLPYIQNTIDPVSDFITVTLTAYTVVVFVVFTNIHAWALNRLFFIHILYYSLLM